MTGADAVRGANQARGLLGGRVEFRGGRGRARSRALWRNRPRPRNATSCAGCCSSATSWVYATVFDHVPSSLTIRRLEANANHGAVTAATTTTTTATTAGDARPGQRLHPRPRRFRLAHNLLRLPARLILVAGRLLLAARARIVLIVVVLARGGRGRAAQAAPSRRRRRLRPSASRRSCIRAGRPGSSA